MLPTDDPIAWACAATVATLAFSLSAGLGIGGPLLLVPTLSALWGPSTAVAYMAPLMLVHCAAKVLIWPQHVDRGLMLQCSLLALPAALLASTFLDELSGPLLDLLLALSLVSALAIRRLGPTSSDFARPTRALLSGLGGVAAALSGIGGPLFVVAVRRTNMGTATFIATVAAVQLGVQIVRTPVYIHAGLLGTDDLARLGMLSVCAVLSVTVLRRWIERLDPSRHMRWVESLLVLVTIAVVVKAAYALGFAGK